ncbi:MAG: Ribonuclease [Acidobacteria bacterium]|nr:Ribonuclease [Acidobacteriota bacterium]
MVKGKAGLRRVGSAFLGAARTMWTHEVPRDAAAISYFGLFALFPGILVLFAIVDNILGRSKLREPVVKSIVLLFPGSESFLKDNLMELTDPSPAMFLACFIVAIWGSTWVFTFFENALNRAWDVPRRRTFWESRIRSIALLLLGGTMLLTSAGITLVVDAQKRLLAKAMPVHAGDELINAMWRYIISGAGILIAITVFFCIYKLMPDHKVRWGEALAGALVATVLWEADWRIFYKLVPAFDPQKVYGIMGVVVALLTWVYASSLIALYGASFSARLHGPEERQAVRSPGTLAAVPKSSADKVRLFRQLGH